MPIMTSPTSNLVVELQRGEVTDGIILFSGMASILVKRHGFCNHKIKHPASETSRGVQLIHDQHPEMNGKKTHQRKVASTHQKKAPHKQKNTSAPAPIRIAVMLGPLVITGSDTGFAGILPAYSVGGGGGEIRVGREATGTAAARGDITVAPGSMDTTSNTSTICSPNETTSPAFSTRGPANRWPFTNVPLVEPRSSSTYFPP